VARDHVLEVIPNARGARLRLMGTGPRPDLELEIVLGAAGPLVRVRANAVELDAEESVAVQCRNFSVRASESMSLSAAGALSIDAAAVHVDAHRGGAVIRANDDVQLLGEQILLNCERPPALPPWVQEGEAPRLLPLSDASGDQELVQRLQSRSKPA
jgi:hypothetical protein